MMTYITLLRGINVSGHKSIKMEDLRKTFENMGFTNVRSYLQSGNIVCMGNEYLLEELELKLSGQIKADFGFDVPVVVLTINKLKEVIDNNPFMNDPEKDSGSIYVTFPGTAINNYNPAIIEKKKGNSEAISISEDAVYLYCPDGYGKTRLTNSFLETQLGVTGTTRNWKTTTELLKMAMETS